jgi:hypothetical protein
MRCERRRGFFDRIGPHRKTVNKTSKRTSGSQPRSRAPARPTRKVARGRPARRAVARESLDALVAFAVFAKREHIRWYLFGAQAVAAYGVPRTTGDIDVTIDLANRGLGTLVAPLRRAGFVPRIADESFAIETQVYPVFHKPTQWNFDLVLAGPGLEQRFLDEVHLFADGRHKIPVIAPEYLVTLKILAGRDIDLEDVRGMIRLAVLDHAKVEQTLAELESMLDQSDLRRVYARLLAEETRSPKQTPPRRRKRI